MKKPIKYQNIILTGIFVLLLVLALKGGITGNLVKEEDEKVVIYFPDIVEFKNDVAGTITFQFNFPSSGFKVKNKTADLLMFLDSKVIPGLKVSYDPKEKKIYAGLPLISSDKVELMDGQPHQLIYGFDSINKKQAIFLDNKLLIEKEYTGVIEENLLTGLTVSENFRFVESDIPITVEVD